MNAPDRATEIKATIVAVIAFFTALWGWVGWAVFLWLGCILLDYIAGTLAAKKAGEWSSAVAREGLWHKLGEIFAVLVAAMCDISLRVVVEGSGVTIPFEIGPVIAPVVLLWYIVTELGSIAENAGKLGAPIPPWLKKSLKQYKDALDQKQGEEKKEAEPEVITGIVCGPDGEQVPDYIKKLWETALAQPEETQDAGDPGGEDTEEQE